MADFIQLNGYDVKDQGARNEIDRIDKVLKNDVATKDDITSINNKIENLNIEEVTNLEITVNKIINVDLTSINQQINQLITDMNQFITESDMLEFKNSLPSIINTYILSYKFSSIKYDNHRKSTRMG